MVSSYRRGTVQAETMGDSGRRFTVQNSGKNGKSGRGPPKF